MRAWPIVVGVLLAAGCRESHSTEATEAATRAASGSAAIAGTVVEPAPPPAAVSAGQGRPNLNARPHAHPAVAVAAGDRAFYRSTFSKTPDVRAMMALGARVFRDPSLSASGKLACATCHDPANAFSPPGDLPIQPGGASGALFGMRAAPTLRYLQNVPPFSEHYHDSDLNDGFDQGPAGGLTWDGRVQSLHDQARSPLFSPEEMANQTPAELAARLRAAAYAGDLKSIFGDDVLASDDSAIKALLYTLEAYQQDPALFYPYTSKFDQVLHGKAAFSPLEARGKAIFEDAARGNCIRCHPDGGPAPAFTDYGYIALAVPRARNAAYGGSGKAVVDLGLCGPIRTDLTSHHEYCGMFRTPTLRNVARKHRFFHNGSLASLRDVIAFYGTRDATPTRWVSDLPAAYARNADHDAPFGGKTARFSDEEIDALVAFLVTLND